MSFKAHFFIAISIICGILYWLYPLGLRLCNDSRRRRMFEVQWPIYNPFHTIVFTPPLVRTACENRLWEPLMKNQSEKPKWKTRVDLDGYLDGDLDGNIDGDLVGTKLGAL
jgi:hypothetical protein